MATYWPYQQKDVGYGAPGWDSKPLRDDGTPGERGAGAFLTHDSVVVQGMADRLATCQRRACRTRSSGISRRRTRPRTQQP